MHPLKKEYNNEVKIQLVNNFHLQNERKKLCISPCFSSVSALELNNFCASPAESKQNLSTEKACLYIDINNDCRNNFNQQLYFEIKNLFEMNRKIFNKIRLFAYDPHLIERYLSEYKRVFQLP